MTGIKREGRAEVNPNFIETVGKFKLTHYRRPLALTAVSHSRAILALLVRMRALLAKGCPLDFHHRRTGCITLQG